MQPNEHLITARLKIPGIGFVKLQGKTKKPFEHEWQKHPYSYDEIQPWITAGNNYGVAGGYGGIAIIDGDHPELDSLLKELFPSTFTVKTGQKGHHFYYRCPAIRKKIVLEKDGEHFGEVISYGGQVVGPGSIHPDTGRSYEVVNDSPIVEVSQQQVLSGLAEYIQADTKQIDADIEPGNIDIVAVLAKAGIAEMRKAGNQLIGAHPVHGSTSGCNFVVHPGKNVWHCFRDNTGGGPLLLIAVLEGVINCAEAVPGGLRGAKFNETCRIAREKYGLEIPIPKKAAALLATDEYQDVIARYGAPYYYKGDEEKSVSTINERFWAGLHHKENIELFEPNEKAFYRYNNKNGLYEEVTQEIVKQEIGDRMLEVSQTERSLQKKINNTALSNIVAHLKGITEKRDAFRNKERLVHLANGVILFNPENEADFVPFSPEFYSRNQSPLVFDEAARCDRFLNELIYPAMTEEDAILLQKYIGMCFLGDNLIQRFLILDGGEGRGKSTIAVIIQKLVGEVNTSELRTQYLDERFELYRYLKKTLLSGIDVPGDFLSQKGAHVLKALVGGDIFDCEQKHGTGSFPLRGNFCIVITSNSRLRVKLDGDLGAWRRRLLIIRFEAPKPPKEIPYFADHLVQQEGSGILNWALKGLAMLFDDIEECGNIALPTKTAEIVDVLLAESDSVRHFLSECVVSDNDSDLSVNELVEQYAEYCPRKGWNPKPITKIYREFEDLMLELFGTSKANSIKRDGKSVRGFRRIKFKADYIKTNYQLQEERMPYLD